MHCATGSLRPYDLIWPRVKGGVISNPLFAYTGLKCKLQQSVQEVGTFNIRVIKNRVISDMSFIFENPLSVIRCAF